MRNTHDHNEIDVWKATLKVAIGIIAGAIAGCIITLFLAFVIAH